MGSPVAAKPRKPEFDNLGTWSKSTGVDALRREVHERIERLEIPFNAEGVDPYGVSRRHLAEILTWLGWFYRHYFAVRVRGLEHVAPRGRQMLVGNHSGGYAVDALMVYAACFFELAPPRLAQSMTDKFLGRLPFMSSWANKMGHLAGLPEHGQRLLEDERLLLVFPEGARGTAKLYKERHSLVRFGTGFVRLALRSRTPIVPFAFLGGGDALPTIANLGPLGRFFGLPYIPLTPYLLNIPLPAPLEVRFGEPILLEGDGDEEDDIIEGKVEVVKSEIARLLAAPSEATKKP